MTELEYRRGLKKAELLQLTTAVITLINACIVSGERVEAELINKDVENTLNQLEAIDNTDFSSNISEEKPF